MVHVTTFTSYVTSCAAVFDIVVNVVEVPSSVSADLPLLYRIRETTTGQVARCTCVHAPVH